MFTYPLIVPSGKKIRVPEIDNRTMFNIIKHSQMKDYEGMIDYLDNIIFNKIAEPLDIVDKFYVLLYVRIVGLGATVQLDSESGNFTKTTSLDLLPIVEKLETIERVDEQVIVIDGFTIKLGLPSKIYFPSQDDLVFDCFKYMKHGKDEVFLHLLSDEEKNKLYEILPPTISSHLVSYADKVIEKMGEITVIPNNIVTKTEETRIRLVSNGPIMLISQLFNQDISSFFEFLYHFVNKIGGSVEDFFKLTYSDCKIILDFYVEEVKKQNDEMNKANR